MCVKRLAAGGGRGSGSMERLPTSIIVNEILVRLDLEALCSAACVSRSLCSAVSQALASISSLDLSIFSPDGFTLNQILSRTNKVNSVTLDCLRLDDSSVINFLGDHIQELNLFKCCLLTSQVLAAIGQRCPNLRVLTLELASQTETFKTNLRKMLNGCLCLESLCIKIREMEAGANGFESMELFLPKNLEALKLQPVLEQDARYFIPKFRNDKNLSGTSTDISIPKQQHFPDFGLQLQSLSLVLDIISDDIIILIVNTLPRLLELDLEDRPTKEPLVSHDLTNSGLQSLGSCHCLSRLSLVRSRQNCCVYFKMISDMGMFLLSEGCRSLESVRLGGFSKVSDAGFSAIIQSCQNLKKFEVLSATLLSDLTFHSGASHSLIEMRLLSCSLITSEAVQELSSSSKLEVLDLSCCRSIADACLHHISCINTLTTLHLGGADVTDSGLAILGKENLPIARLSLRGCKRITDKGIAVLLCGGGTISKTLSSLDIGFMPGITDRSIRTVAGNAQALTELCIRFCFFLTDATLETLASLDSRPNVRIKLLRRLDLFHCDGLSAKSLRFLRIKPLFRGLQWLGVGLTRLASNRDAFSEICRERPWLVVCFDGCESGCHDGWQFHGKWPND